MAVEAGKLLFTVQCDDATLITGYAFSPFISLKRFRRIPRISKKACALPVHVLPSEGMHSVGVTVKKIMKTRYSLDCRPLRYRQLYPTSPFGSFIARIMEMAP